MEDLPLDVIGNILSRVGSCRDAIRASLTSRDWREAFKSCLHTLSFSSEDWPRNDVPPIASLETLITEAIFQTSGLKCLLLLLEDLDYFSPEVVLSWIDHTRELLKELRYGVNTDPHINILEYIDREKLEVLELRKFSVIQRNFPLFPHLRCLVLRLVTLYTRDFWISINSCPALDSLELISVGIVNSEGEHLNPDTVALIAPSLKRLYIEEMFHDKILLLVDNLRVLCLKDFYVGIFDIIGKRTLRHLIMEKMNPSLPLDLLDEVQNIETLELSDFAISWPALYMLISRASTVRKLRLWKMSFVDQPGLFDLDRIATRLRMLSHLSLCYNVKDESRPFCRPGYQSFEQVISLTVGWSILFSRSYMTRLFANWVEELILVCPRLRHLVITGHEGHETLGRITTYIVRVLQQYPDLEVHFVYKDSFET